MIKSWSYTRLTDFEKCAFYAKLKYHDRIPDPRPAPAAERGTAIHQMAEDYVKGKLDELPNELRHFENEFNTLLRSDKIDLEQEWGFDHDWQPTSWAKAWGRVKADCVAHISPTEAVVVDYKTGKKFGNEVKHGEQLMLYALSTFIMYPELEKVTAELWYLDINDMSDLIIPKKVAMKRYLRMFDERARRMTTATEFKPNPNIYSCRYCPYGETGDCTAHVSDKKADSDFFKRRNSRS